MQMETPFSLRRARKTDPVITGLIQLACRVALLLALLFPGWVASRSDGAVDVNGQRSPAPPVGTTQLYECAGLPVMVRYGPGEVAIWLPGRYSILSWQYRLPGTVYSEGDIELRIEKDDVELVIDGVSFTPCLEPVDTYPAYPAESE